MNLQQLKYVQALSEEGTFIAAAARCAVTQPTLSNAIAQLEAELGQKIFYRTTRSLGLTKFGADLMPKVRDVLAGVHRLQELALCYNGAKGTAVHVGISTVVGVRQAASVLQRFSQSKPELEVIYREKNFDDALWRLLKTEQIDVVFAPLDVDSARPMDCVFKLLQRDQLLFVPNGLTRREWCGRDQVDILELAEQKFVLVPSGCGLTRVTKRHFENHNLFLHRYPGEASSCRVVQEWAGLGLGSGILPASKVDHNEAHQLAIPIVERGRPLTIDYYAFGKPNTISGSLFAELWESLSHSSVDHQVLL